jgi:hypothetical protein
MMKAKKIIKLELKNPALRRIRKNFRDLIKFAVKQEANRLFDKSCEFRKKSRESADSVEKEDLKAKEINLRNRSNELDRLLSRSIIQCGLGGGCLSLSEAIEHGFDPKDRPTDLDMVWVPSNNGW